MGAFVDDGAAVGQLKALRPRRQRRKRAGPPEAFTWKLTADWLRPSAHTCAPRKLRCSTTSGRRQASEGRTAQSASAIHQDPRCEGHNLSYLRGASELLFWVRSKRPSGAQHAPPRLRHAALFSVASLSSARPRLRRPPGRGEGEGSLNCRGPKPLPAVRVRGERRDRRLLRRQSCARSWPPCRRPLRAARPAVAGHPAGLGRRPLRLRGPSVTATRERAAAYHLSVPVADATMAILKRKGDSEIAKPEDIAGQARRLAGGLGPARRAPDAGGRNWRRPALRFPASRPSRLQRGLCRSGRRAHPCRRQLASEPPGGGAPAAGRVRGRPADFRAEDLLQLGRAQRRRKRRPERAWWTPNSSSSTSRESCASSKRSFRGRHGSSHQLARAGELRGPQVNQHDRVPARPRAGLLDGLATTILVSSGARSFSVRRWAS